MIGLVVATHGPLAEALLTTVELIVGAQPCALAVSLCRSDAPEELRARLAQAIEQAGQGCEAVLLVTDMFGGTPSNIGMELLAPGRVELLTGVNLPMLLKFFSYRGTHGLTDLALLLRDQARGGILIAGELLERQP
jgi:PTS system mannose-specific IIA component